MLFTALVCALAGCLPTPECAPLPGVVPEVSMQMEGVHVISRRGGAQAGEAWAARVYGDATGLTLEQVVLSDGGARSLRTAHSTWRAQSDTWEALGPVELEQGPHHSVCLGVRLKARGQTLTTLGPCSGAVPLQARPN